MYMNVYFSSLRLHYQKESTRRCLYLHHHVSIFRCFQKECPDGNMTREHLESLSRKVFPSGDSAAFCDHIFRIFDDDNNKTLEFKEFLMAIAVTQCNSERDRLTWAFRLYDIDASGTINVTEMETIIQTLDQIEGRTAASVCETGIIQ